MIIRNNVTKKEYPVTESGWDAIKAKGWQKNFTVVGAANPKTIKPMLQTSFVPDEIKSTKPAPKTVGKQNKNN